MRGVASPVPFEGALTLPDGPPPLVPIAAGDAAFGPEVTLDGIPGLSGPFPPDGFTVLDGASPRTISNVTVLDDTLTLQLSGFGSWSQVIYDGSNADFNAAPGGILQAFDIPVPYP